MQYILQASCPSCCLETAYCQQAALCQEHCNGCMGCPALWLHHHHHQRLLFFINPGKFLELQFKKNKLELSFITSCIINRNTQNQYMHKEHILLYFHCYSVAGSLTKLPSYIIISANFKSVNLILQVGMSPNGCWMVGGQLSNKGGTVAAPVCVSLCIHCPPDGTTPDI